MDHSKSGDNCTVGNGNSLSLGCINDPAKELADVVADYTGTSSSVEDCVKNFAINPYFNLGGRLQSELGVRVGGDLVEVVPFCLDS